MGEEIYPFANEADGTGRQLYSYELREVINYYQGNGKEPDYIRNGGSTENSWRLPGQLVPCSVHFSEEQDWERQPAIFSKNVLLNLFKNFISKHKSSLVLEQPQSHFDWRPFWKKMWFLVIYLLL